MGNSTTFRDIEKKYGQNGIDYVAFRYHQRKNYYRVKQLICILKDHASLQQHQALQFIDQEKRLLQGQFKSAKQQAEAYHPDSIKIAEAQSKQTVQDFSGYNLQLKRLEEIHLDVKSKFEAEKASMEKRIRYQIMKQQNKSAVKGIIEFDEKSDSQRRKIQNQCIKMHPQKASQNNYHNFESKYTWQNEREPFDSIFDKEKTQKDSKQARIKVRQNVIPNKKPVCC